MTTRLPIPDGVDLLVLPKMHLLDLSGPAQVLAHRAVRCPVRMIGPARHVTTAQGLPLGPIEDLPDRIAPNRWLLVIGSTELPDWLDSATGRDTARWLRERAGQWTRVGSVCAGALMLADAGLLDGRRATTHHSLLAELRTRAPEAEVIDDRLFCDDGERCTSAGLSSAIDLALHLVACHWGDATAKDIARDLVIYPRAVHGGQNLPFDSLYRQHPDQRIQSAQDRLERDLGAPGGVTALADSVHLSERQFRRRFRAATGLPVKRYLQLARLARSESLLHNPALSIEQIAEQSGLADARSLQRLWQRERGCSPSAAREEVRAQSSPTPPAD